MRRPARDAANRRAGDAAMKTGRTVGVGGMKSLTEDEALGMIIPGKRPPGAKPGAGAIASN
ncbi:MAG TPA: hypothetical protein VEF36_00105 [Roseiarcus sp.]|nr:hypothetical protein [Roseiarcus sp.]